MGNFIGLESGLDSFDSVNNIVTGMIYMPPLNNKNNIKNLANNKNVKLFDLSYNNLKINVLQITPPNILHENKIIIFSHGNGTDNYDMFTYLNLLSTYLGVIVVSYDYPTYGLSEGKLSENTCNNSLSIVMWHYLKSNKKVLLIGQSLGTGIVLDYVYHTKWSSPIMLISPYKSIPKVLIDNDFIESCVSYNKYQSHKKINNITCPVKIFHGNDDKLIDISHSKYLYKNLKNKTLKPVWINNVGHNDIINKITLDEYLVLLNLL